MTTRELRRRLHEVWQPHTWRRICRYCACPRGCPTCKAVEADLLALLVRVRDDARRARAERA